MVGVPQPEKGKKRVWVCGAEGREPLVRPERQSRVVSRDDSMLDRILETLDEIIGDEGIDHVLQGFREQAARQVGIHLDLLRDDGNLADPEPAERIVETDTAALR